ncbi:MAG: TRAP transporter large permease subunit, partial [Firmicutes bacterium]|nr:TRAP transporter large permease subunit [Bacillota bacterium]
FVFYFGIVADITPPVALAAYAGSAIAKSNPMKTGINATKLAIAAFIVPYVFAYSSEMLFVDVNSVFEVVQICVSAFIGIFGVAACLNGYLYKPINVILRIVLLAGGLTLIIPGTVTDLIGIVLVGGVTAYQYISAKKERASLA